MRICGCCVTQGPLVGYHVCKTIKHGDTCSWFVLELGTFLILWKTFDCGFKMKWKLFWFQLDT
jgi:hypothetical protein